MVEKSKRTRRRERHPRQPFDLGLEPVHSAILDRVLETRVAPIRAIAVVSLGNENGTSNGIDCCPGWNEAEDICEPRKGFDIAMVHAHARRPR